MRTKSIIFILLFICTVPTTIADYYEYNTEECGLYDCIWNEKDPEVTYHEYQTIDVPFNSDVVDEDLDIEYLFYLLEINQ